MPTLAEGQPSLAFTVDLSSNPTTGVLPVSDRFKMGGVYAMGDSAEMVYLEAIGDRPDESLV